MAVTRILIVAVALVTFGDAANMPNLQVQRGPDYQVTMSDVRDAMVALVSVTHEQSTKLDRHELRERQLGEQLTKTLNMIDRRMRGDEKNIENLAKLLGSVEEKLKSVKSTVEKQADDYKAGQEMLKKEIQTVKQAIPKTSGSANSAQLTKIEGKISSLENKINQVVSASDRHSRKLDDLSTKVESTASEAAAAAASAAAQVASHNAAAVSAQVHSPSTSAFTGGVAVTELSEALSDIKESLARNAELGTQLLSKQDSSSENSEGLSELTESLDAQRRQLSQLEEDMSRTLSFLGDISTITSGVRQTVENMQLQTHEGMQTIERQMDSLLTNTSEDMQSRLAEVSSAIHSGQQQLETKLQETEHAVDALGVKVDAGHEQMSRELKGLANVESVLLDTGDSVLDTKRRLEYGVQQIMGEINSQLGEYSTKLNESLQQRFDGLTTAVLGNQSIALTNLTARMEGEISQVWRQIGILYHQVSRSVTILDEVHAQTSKYVNRSMDTMSSMDGKVGSITNSVDEVSHNLNHILGRMSLVFQEFRMIKGGLGEALQDLKESFSGLSDDEKAKIKNATLAMAAAESLDGEGGDVKRPIPQEFLQQLGLADPDTTLEDIL